MRKLLALATVAALVPAAAQAAPTVVNFGPVITTNSGTYSAKLTGTSGNFTDIFTFSAPAGYNLQSIDLSSNYTGKNYIANVNFTSATLNGVALNIVSTGQAEIRNLFDQPLWAGVNTISLMGNAGYKGKVDAVFGGNLSFARNSVPEPSIWAFMILGLGGVGGAMRRRNRTRTTVRFA